MKEHERTELLSCAQRVATALHQAPADVPVEGYYSEDSALTEYFGLMRALQGVSLGRASEVEAIPAFQRLLAVTSSPIFGSPVREYLLPTGRDPLSAAVRGPLQRPFRPRAAAAHGQVWADFLGRIHRG